MTEAEKGPNGQSKFIFSEVLSRLLERLIKESPDKKQPPDSENVKKIITRMQELGVEKDTGIKYEEAEAKKFTQTVQSKQDNITPWMKQWKEANKYSHRLPIDQAQLKLEAALAVSKDNIAWSEITKAEDVHSPVVAEYLSTLSLLPTDFVKNPNVFFRLTSRFAASMSEDPVAHAQEIQILNKAIKHQEELRVASPDKGFTLKKEDTIYTLRGVVIYDEGLGDKIDPSAKPFVKELQQAFDNNRSNLASMEKDNLRNRKKDLERGNFDILEPEMKEENGKNVPTGKNKKNPQHIEPEKVKTQIQRINRRLEELELLEESQRGSSRYRGAESVTGASIEGKKWLEDVVLPPTMVESVEHPGVILDKTPLHKLYNELNEEGDNPREDYFKDAHKRLNALVEGSKKHILDKDGNLIGIVYQITDVDINPLKKKLEQAYKTMYGERRDLNPINMEELKTFDGRDSQFYKIMSQLTNNPNLSSRDLLDLPFTTKWDSFVHALSEIDFDETTLPKGVSLSDAKASVIAQYTNLRETLTACHDLDFQARNAAGDIKNYKGALAYFQNHYFIEAIMDPLSQEAARCYEETLKQAIDNNGGWIPSDYVSYKTDLGFCQWDKDTKYLMIQRAKAGQIYETERDSIGNAIKERAKEGQPDRLKRKEEPYVFNENEDTVNKFNAAMRMGKGTGLVTMRLLEMFAYSKVPGYNTRPGGGTFSSNAYEGIARYLNPMDHLFGKFRMGDQRHNAFFCSLVGIEQSDIMSLIKNNDAKQFEKIQQMVVTGELEGWLREKYPKDVDKHVKTFRDARELLAFSGQLGPLSQWRTVDSTLRMTDFERERLGGSMRLQRAAAFGTGAASEKIQNNPIDKKLKEENPHWDSLSKEDRKALKVKIIAETPEFANAVREREHYYRLQSEHKRKPFDEMAEEYADAYKVFVYAQMAERSPVILAHGIKDHYHTEMLKNTETPKLLRTVIIEDILSNDAETQKMLKKKFEEKNGRPPVLKLDMARDVIALSTPSIEQREFQIRVNTLEDDVMLLQRIAMEGVGGSRMPREIQKGDLAKIEGTRTLVWNGEEFASINEATRRQQAWEYVQAVRDRVLGKDKTSKYWHDKIDAAYDKEDGSLIIKSPKKVEELMLEAKNQQLLLDEKLLTRIDPIHMGTEDLQWSYLDLYILGERSPARRGNDLENDVNTTNLEIEYLSLLHPHPDQDVLAKKLGDIKKSEDNVDPKESHKKVWLFTYATGQLYRQGPIGFVPFVGKILPKVGVALSPMQVIETAADAVAWSANNTHQFIDKVREQTGLPARPINQRGELDPYNVHSLEHSLGATKRVAIIEMILLGYSLAAVAVALSAVTKSVEDEKKKE